MAASPTSRTMQTLKGEGWRCGVVERFIGPTQTRKDLFGIIDLIAIRPWLITGVQCCALSGMAAHRKKLMEENADATRAWLEATGRLEIWAWRKYANKIDRKVWRPTVTSIIISPQTRELEFHVIRNGRTD